MNRIYVTLIFCLLVFTTWADGSRYASKSALAEGRWVKICVAENGIYKLTYAELRKMGFSDPAKVSVHGYGGWILDEDFSQPYIDDLPAVALWRGNDYLLFYGRGAVKWSYRKDHSLSIYDNFEKQFVHENNPYSMYGYYFVTDATGTNEIKTTSSVSGTAQQLSVFDDYKVHEEKEGISLKQSGRELYSESFGSKTSQEFPFQIPGITNDEGLVTLRFVSGSGGSASLSVNGSALPNSVNMPIQNPIDEYEKGVALFAQAKWGGAKSEQNKVTISYSLSNRQNVHLDYIRVQMKRKLQSYGEAYTFFRSLDAQYKATRFLIENASSGMMVWDVTDGVNPTKMETTLSGSILSFSIPEDRTLREFVLIDPSKPFLLPNQIGEVQAQNLHGLGQQEMIILAQPAFVSEAKRLAEHHRTHTKLTVEVVTPEQVYNEFSSGTPDATAIRRLMKMFYDRRSSEADAPRFLLLFGDGSYDNRQLTSTWKSLSMDNFLLTYQTQNSLNSGSYVVDDYFGLLADNEGSKPYSDSILLGIGRFPVRTVTEAKAAVDKVINYTLNKKAGNWKNQICFVADDGTSKQGFEQTHMKDANELADSIELKHPAYLVNKQFFDAYEKISVAGKMGYPGIAANIVKQLKEGILVINYMGHGNSTSWSDEQVLTDKQIQAFTYQHLPLWITATCDFSPFDNSTTSAGEYVFLNAKSGGIALITTTRVAFADYNKKVNKSILKELFDKKEGNRPTLGEVFKKMKQDNTGLYRQGFALLGDPALILTFPEYQLKITEINGQPVGNEMIQFKALEKITIKGEVNDEKNNKATGFNGILSATIMDSRDSVTTRNNNNSKNGKFKYTEYRNRLQKINEKVHNGEFEFSFVVPSLNSYSGLPGKISLYALHNTANIEANGAFNQFTVGGTVPNPETDNKGPEIRAVYLNDTTFTDGGKVNDTPFFVAQLWDKSGVYIGGSSIGHDMTLTIDNNPHYSYNMNAYYETLSGGQEGIVKFPVSSLPEGIHTAEFSVYDVMANSTMHTFTFEVEKGLKPFITELIAAPSPAHKSVTFMLSHNRPESEMKVNIRVYNMIGQIEWEHEESGSSELFKTYNVTWDLTNGGGVRLRPGLYIYRAGIRTGTSFEATDAKKLIILGK